ncbi:YafY family protein [Terrarubrum flagellatum]|uniref:helix-turn-helix transcriptional regulator n=1 Tax=Terrirubrum flagellatum TaxID=2895980 RepID=UPI003144DA73
MRRADRLFDIIQALRSSAQPLTASWLAAHLEVGIRTIYRDIATLQARRVPIEGASGVGYMLRRGYDLPPLMFTPDEIDAIAVGVRMVRRLRDNELQSAAERVLSKLTTVVPESVRPSLASPRIWISDGSASAQVGFDLADLRNAIRTSSKLLIGYVDKAGERSARIIRPVAMVYYVDATLVAAWCELRGDFRHFRIERIETCTVLAESFATEAPRLMAEWRQYHLKEDAVPQ